MLHDYAYTVELDKGVQRFDGPKLLATLDEGADRFTVAVTKAGQAAALTGFTLTALFVRPDGATVVLDGISPVNNTVAVTLTDLCYTCRGGFALTMKLEAQDNTVTLCQISGWILESRTDTTADYGQAQPSVDELISDVEVLSGQLDGINSALTPLATDTGWVDLSSYANSYITPQSDYFMGRRTGNVVHLRLQGTAASAFGQNAWVAVTSQIPSQFRPDYISTHVMDSSMTETDLVRLKVDTDGYVSVYRRGANIPSGQWFRGDIVYTVGGAPVPSQE